MKLRPNNKPIIIAIVGASGSGKTLASQILQEHLQIPTIVSYTTRPIREEETDGVEHFFVSKSDMPPMQDMLAYTFFGNHHYWATIEQAKNLQVCSYVVDEAGLLELYRNQRKTFRIIPVLVNRNIHLRRNQITRERLARDKKRTPLHENYFRLIVRNDYSKEQFAERLVSGIQNVLNYHQLNF